MTRTEQHAFMLAYAAAIIRGTDLRGAEKVGTTCVEAMRKINAKDKEEESKKHKSWEVG